MYFFHIFCCFSIFGCWPSYDVMTDDTQTHTHCASITHTHFTHQALLVVPIDLAGGWARH